VEELRRSSGISKFARREACFVWPTELRPPSILVLYYMGGSLMNIYVGNLSYDASEEDLRQAFSEYGEVSSVNVITDRETGRSRGFAFVEMPNKDEANQAISSLNLQQIAGRAVTVNEARPRNEGGGRRGGGGGGGRRRY
jgi:hypothetical protein